MLRKSTLLVLLLASACATDHDDQADGTTSPLKITTCPGPRTDAYLLGDLTIEGSVLHAQVSAGGGCKQHSFSVCWDGAVADSAPPQARLDLAYNAHGDPCDAQVNHDVQIDLASLPDWLERPVVFHVTGAGGQIPDSTNSVTYE